MRFGTSKLAILLTSSLCSEDSIFLHGVLSYIGVYYTIDSFSYSGIVLFRCAGSSGSRMESLKHLVVSKSDEDDRILYDESPSKNCKF